MASALQSFWDGCVNLFMLYVVLGGLWFGLRGMKWKYEPGAKQRDLGMLKTGAGLTRAFFGR